ncbi:M23 family metallopeptidase [Pseudarthrobacter sp. P1]|uniref:M23 family metallopeptidase n=1 Tax=Pseudarthrobacter sp. P1 TaxID=3418418 RepID=UPI003CEA78CD
MDRPRRTHRRIPPLLAALCCLLLLAATQLGPQPPDAAAARAPSWTWPLAPRPAVVHPFAPPAKPWLSGHRGVDLAAPQGSTVLAPADGIVVFSGWVVDRGVLTLRHANGLLGSFEPVDSPLEPGTEVAAGAQLGTLAGRTHCGPGPPGPGSCLHWGVRRGEEYINPLQFVLDLRPSILLPLTR